MRKVRTPSGRVTPPVSVRRAKAARLAYLAALGSGLDGPRPFGRYYLAPKGENPHDLTRAQARHVARTVPDAREDRRVLVALIWSTRDAALYN